MDFWILMLCDKWVRIWEQFFGPQSHTMLTSSNEYNLVTTKQLFHSSRLLWLNISSVFHWTPEIVYNNSKTSVKQVKSQIWPWNLKIPTQTTHSFPWKNKSLHPHTQTHTTKCQLLICQGMFLQIVVQSIFVLHHFFPQNKDQHKYVVNVILSKDFRMY